MNTIQQQTVQTPRARISVRTVGDAGKSPVMFVHGNCSSAAFWDGVLAALPAELSGTALDLRGFGDSETLPIDATRGLGDFADDLHGLWRAQGDGEPIQIVGHSVGGGIGMQLCLSHPEMVRSLVLVAPVSPYGFGGTRGLDGELCCPDGAGSGGAGANPEFVKRLGEKDAGDDSDFSPRSVFRAFYVHQFQAPDEDALVKSMLTTVVGENNYPGDSAASEHWPAFAPGKRGMNNAISPVNCNLSAFAEGSARPPVLWIRGDKDAIVSDNSMFDLGALGALGAVPGWPGADTFPAQPMVGQMRAVLERYAKVGGRFREEVLADCGHTPYVEKPDAFMKLLNSFLLDHR